VKSQLKEDQQQLEQPGTGDNQYMQAESLQQEEEESAEPQDLESGQQAKKQRVEECSTEPKLTSGAEVHTCPDVKASVVMELCEEGSSLQRNESADISTLHGKIENELEMSGAGEAERCEEEQTTEQAKVLEGSMIRENFDVLVQTSAQNEEENDSCSCVGFTDTVPLPGAPLAVPEDPESGGVEVQLLHKSVVDDYFKRLWRLKLEKKGPRIGPKYQHEVPDIPDNFQPLDNNQVPAQDTVPCVWRPMTEEDSLEAYLEQARRIVRLEVQNRIRSSDGHNCQGLPHHKHVRSVRI
jgi:hypothetical protein